MNHLHVLITLGCLSHSALLAESLYEGFACPTDYADATPIADAVPLSGKSEGGWKSYDKLPEQQTGAFLVTKDAAPEKTLDAKPAMPTREERASQRAAEREKLKSLPREERKKKEDAAGLIKDGMRQVARIKRSPGHLALIPGQKLTQGIIHKFKKPLKAPIYLSFILEPDSSPGNPVSFVFEDVNGKDVISILYRFHEQRIWKLETGTASATINCDEKEGPMFVVFGMEPDKKERDLWHCRYAINPAVMTDPFLKSGYRNTAKFSGELEEIAAIRITKGPATKATLDEIRVGEELRDVLP